MNHSTHLVHVITFFVFQWWKHQQGSVVCTGTTSDAGTDKCLPLQQYKIQAPTLLILGKLETAYFTSERSTYEHIVVK